MNNPTILYKIKWQIKRKTKTVYFFFRILIYPFKTINGIKIPVFQTFSYQMKDEIFKGTYEKNEIATISENLIKNDVVLELGTCIGYVSAYCASKIGSQNVHTFEANKNMDKYISELYKINQVSPIINFCILSYKNGTVDFYHEPNNFFASSLFKLSNTSVKTSVEMFDINEILLKIKPNFLIIDIEGGEYDLIKHIDFSSINKIAIELHKSILGDAKIAELLNIFKMNNFKQVKELDRIFYYFQK